ncbi:MAG: S41 family peptidase [Pseudomonadales bacterium]
MNLKFPTFLVGSLLLCSQLGYADQQTPDDVDPLIEIEIDERLPLAELRRFTDAFAHIRANYVEDVSDADLLNYAIQGMLSGLDPHSAYLEPEDYSELQQSTTGEFGGLGLEVGMEDGFIRVVSPIDDTPAARAGMESGDLIIRLDGQAVKGMSLDEAINLMRGEKDSEIKITFLREGGDGPKTVTIVRDIIKVASVRTKELEPGFAYLRIAQFQAKTGDEVAEKLKELLEKGPVNGLVMDLRNNPGGVLQAAVGVVDAVQDEGMIVYTEGRVEEAGSEFEATSGDLLNGTPIVVLINGGSASASEIVAGALQDHKRAVIMGTESFGKGSVQAVIPLAEDRAIKLTTALYYTPNGRSIQAQGISPDIEIERARVETIRPRSKLSEADLSGHLDNGNEKDEKVSAKETASANELIERDNQLYEALTLLKGLYIIESGRRAKIEPLAELDLRLSADKEDTEEE